MIELLGDTTPALAHGPILGWLLSDDRSPSYGQLSFRVEPGQHTAPGQLVAVHARDGVGRPTIVLARVLDVHEVNPHEDARSSALRGALPFETVYAAEGTSTVIYRCATAEPLEQAALDQHGLLGAIGSVNVLPPAGAPVFRSGPALSVAALGLRDTPAAGLHLGAQHGSPDIPIVLAPEIVQRHVFIGGGIGSGKSYTRGVLLEELWAWGVPQVNLDVNGEMIAATDELGGTNLRPGPGGLTLPLSALTPDDVVDAVPSINRGTNMETLLRFTHERLLREVSAGTRDHFDVDALVDAIDDAASTLEMTTGTGDQRRPDRRTVEPVKLRTRSLRRLDFLGAPYDWAAALGPGAIVNIDCRGLQLSELRLVAASVIRDLQRLAVRRAIDFTVLSIDEFHLVAPNDGDAITTQALREIARLGRHYRLGLVLTTQSPSDVDRSVLKRLLTRFLHAIEPDQLDALRGVFSDASPELIRAMPKMAQGTCVLTGAMETVRHAVVVDVRSRRTTHGGATPDVFGELAASDWGGKHSLPGDSP